MKTGISAHWRRCLLWDLIFNKWRKIGKFFHQIMYGSHLMNSANIASAEDKPIFNITFYSIDQRLSNAIRNSARIALGKAVIAFFYWLTLSFYILDELIAKCCPAFRQGFGLFEYPLLWHVCRLAYMHLMRRILLLQQNGLQFEHHLRQVPMRGQCLLSQRYHRQQWLVFFCCIVFHTLFYIQLYFWFLHHN